MIRTARRQSLESQYFLNLASQAIGRAVSFGANFVSYIIIGRIAGIEFFGKFSYVLAFLGLFAAIADSGMCSVLGRGITHEEKQAGLYWGNFLFLRVALSLAVIPFGIIAAFYLRRDLFPILLPGMLAIPFLAARFFEPIFQVYRRPWHSTYSSVSYGVSYCLLLALVLIFTKSLLFIVCAFVVSNTIYAIVAFSLSWRSIKPVFVPDLPLTRSILKLAVPLGISSLFVIITARIPILMLAAMKSDDAVAIYNAGYRFVELSALLAAALSAPLIPVFAARALTGANALKRMFVPLIELVAIVAVPIAIVVPVVSGSVVTLLFGQAFAGAAPVLDIMAWICVIIFYSLFSSAAAIGIGSVKYAYWSAASAAALCLGFNYFLIPHYSFRGAAWVALGCEAFLATVTFCYVTGRLGNVFRWRKWVKIGCLNVLLYVVLNVLLSGVMPFLRVLVSLAIYALLVFVLRVAPAGFLALFSEKESGETGAPREGNADPATLGRTGC